MERPPREVGVVGVGTMGTPMAEHLLAAGFRVAVHDLDRSRVDRLVAAGATAAGSPAETARRSQAVICMLPLPADTETVLFGADGVAAGLAPGGTVIDMSTTSPAFARRTAAALAARGLDFLEAPVTLGPSGARTGTLTIMVSGDRASFERHRPVFEAMGQRLFFLGEHGRAQLAKLTSNLVSLVALGSIAEALVLGVKGGLPADALYEIFEHSIADSRVLRSVGPRILAGDFAPVFALELVFKDLDLALEAGREHAVPLPLTAACRELVGFARAAGRGGLDCGAVITALEDACGIRVRSGAAEEGR
jgi:3-hydroxyisobutyrate dehydrogenase-like beta-hydroxyacid dehydrogenase